MKTSGTYCAMWEKLGHKGKNSKYGRNEDIAHFWPLTFGIVENPEIQLHFR